MRMRMTGLGFLLVSGGLVSSAAGQGVRARVSVRTPDVSASVHYQAEPANRRHEYGRRFYEREPQYQGFGCRHVYDRESLKDCLEAEREFWKDVREAEREYAKAHREHVRESEKAWREDLRESAKDRREVEREYWKAVREHERESARRRRERHRP